MMLRKKYKKLLNEDGFKIYFNIKQWMAVCLHMQSDYQKE